MPRAIDPSQPGGGLPITHNPLNRVRYDVIPQKQLNLRDVIDEILANRDGYLRDFLFPGIKLLTGIDLSNWQNLFDGMSLQNFFERFLRRGDPISISSLADFIQNLLINPLFSGSAAIADNPRWTQDITVGHDVSDSVKVVADGTLQALRSDPIRVIVGQDFTLSTWVRWDGFGSASNVTFPLTFPFTFGGSAGSTFPLTFPFTFGQDSTVPNDPIRLEAVGLRNGVEMNRTVIAAIANPTQSSNDYPTSDDDGHVQLVGTYTAPGGIDEMVMRLVVDTSAIAGELWFSDASRTKIGLLQMDWMEGLTDLFTRIFRAFGGTGAWVEHLENFQTNLRTWLDHRGEFDMSVSPDQFEPLNFMPQNLQDVVDSIFDGFFNDGVSSTAGNPISSILDAIFGTKNIGNVAQHSGNTANAGVARLEARLAAEDASGTYLFDGFDYPNANSLPATYTKVTDGSITANYGPNGSGNVDWTGLSGTIFYRRNDVVLTTDNGEIHAVVARKASTGLLLSNPDLYLIGRSNSAFDSRIQCKISANGDVVFQAMVSGSTTTLSAIRNVALRDGDHIIYRFGTQLVARKHVLVINDVTVYDFTESGTVSQLGAAFRYCGFGGHAEAPSIIFVYEPPALAAFVMSDQAT